MGWKLVRDRDDTYCPPLGVSGQWRIAADPVSGLAGKLIEEAGEFAISRDPVELYDLRDAVNELISRLDPDGQAAAAHDRKIFYRGRFTRGLEWNALPPGGVDPSGTA